MTEILNPKVNTSGLLELVGTGVVKQFEEKITSPFIGNATLMSGGIKLVGGYMGKQVFKGKLDIIPNAVLIDAGEDLALGLLSMVSGAGSGKTNEWS